MILFKFSAMDYWYLQFQWKESSKNKLQTVNILTNPDFIAGV